MINAAPIPPHARRRWPHRGRRRTHQPLVRQPQRRPCLYASIHAAPPWHDLLLINLIAPTVVRVDHVVAASGLKADRGVITDLQRWLEM